MDEKQVQQRQELSRQFRETIDRKMGLETSDLWNNVKLSISNITRRVAHSTEPVQSFEFDLHDLWYVVIQCAKITPADSPVQAWLINQILYARELGVLLRPASVESDDGSRSVVQTEEGVIWKNLPFLVADATEAWEESEELPLVERQNLGAFIARLAAVGVCDPRFAQCALWSLQNALETPCKEQEPAINVYGEIEENGVNSDTAPAAEAAMVALVWLRYCGHKMLIWSMQDLHTREESEGFSLARWARWKHLLDSMEQKEDIVLAQCALRGLNLMEQVEKDFGIST